MLGTYSQFTGSLEPGSLIDGGPHALTASSRNSSVLGRYIFNIGGEIPLPEGSINGQVTDREGKALAASIEVCPAGGETCISTVASGAGNYSTIGLAPGDYVVTATGPFGRGLPPRTLPITVSSGETANLDFVLYETLVDSLEISVVDMHSDPVDGTIISVCDESTGDCLAAVPNSSATAPTVLANIPVGNYDIDVTAPTGSSLLGGTAAAIVAEDETTNASVTLLPQTNNTISGVVVDQDGDPVQATLTLVVVDSAGDAPLAGDSPLLGTGSNPQQTAADGAFKWTVATGDYSVSAATEFCGDTAQSVSFDNDGNATVTLTVTCPREAAPTTPASLDDASDTTLEKTDGNGPYLLVGLAVVFMIMGGGLLLSRRRS